MNYFSSPDKFLDCFRFLSRNNNRHYNRLSEFSLNLYHRDAFAYKDIRMKPQNENDLGSIAYLGTSVKAVIYIKASLFVCLCACISQMESRITTKLSQHIWCTMRKKVMELVLIDFHWGSSVIYAFDAPTDAYLNGLHKAGVI